MTKTRSVMMGLLGLVAAATLSGAVAVQDTGAAKKAKVGEPAPNFTLTGVDGKEYTLEDYRGKLVVIQWIDPECPACRRVMTQGVVADMIKELKTIDEEYVHIAINSRKRTTPEANKKYLEDNKIDIIALVDSDQSVGKLYEARTTPHLFVVDTEGVLRYSGALDDGNAGRTGDTNYIVEALNQIKAGETVSPNTTRPYG